MASPYQEVLAAAHVDGGGWVHNIRNPAFGGISSGVWDSAFLNAVDLMPTTGGIIVIPPHEDDYPFDSVNLSSIGKENIRVIALGARLTKAATTDYHMFYDLASKLDRFTWIGGKIDLSRSDFIAGDTVSFFHGIRLRRLLFADMEILDGIEEGLKLYKPQKLRVLNSEFSNCRNNGVQVHAPATDTGYTGSRDDQDTEDVLITGCGFYDIDDDADGTLDGQAVAISGTSTTQTARRVFVVRNHIEGCVRGPWAEFNQAGIPGEGIHFDDNDIEENLWHGAGLIGCRNSTLNGNRVRNSGYMAPTGGTSSEVLGLILSGSSDPRGSDNVCVGNTVLETRTGGSAFMQYGIIVKNNDRAVVRSNRVRGMTVKDYDVEWGTGKVLNSSVERGCPPIAKAYRNASQTIGTGSWTNLSPDTQVTDSTEYLSDGTGGMWSSSSNPERILFKEPGRYLLQAGVRWPSDATGERGMRIYTDDGTTAVLEAEDIRDAVNGDDTSMTIQTIVEVTEAQVDATPNRFMRVQLYQNSGGDISVSGRYVFMSAARLGPLDGLNA